MRLGSPNAGSVVGLDGTNGDEVMEVLWLTTHMVRDGDEVVIHESSAELSE